MNTARIRNPHALLRLVGHARKPPKGAWGELAEPIDPLETTLRARAQSILSGPLIGQCPPLTIDQARDVLTWHNPANNL